MRTKKQEPISVGFISLGCPKNLVDSERMLSEIVQGGYLITSETEKADVIIVNTCGFIAPAKAEAIEAIKEAVKSKRRGPVRKVIVAGCLSQRMGRELFNEVKGIDAIVGLGQRDEIAAIIEATLNSQEPGAYLGHPCRNIRDEIPDDRVRARITPRHWAYVRISEGCDHRCSFCTIPSIRGPFRSKPMDLVLAEALELVSAGSVELNIIGQDTTYYGRDLKQKNGLANLLAELEKIRGLRWIRLMYSYPTWITGALIGTMAGGEKLVHYIDMPIQHINDKILKAMRRPDTRESLSGLIAKLRSALPDIVLRTTVIVGFPGETDEQFNELLEFIRWAEFDALGCFEYYAESGTAAAEMPGQVPEAVKDRRLDELMLTQQQIAFTMNKNRIGNTLTCLVDSVGVDGTARGRFYGQAPDIDSVCIIEGYSGRAGQFIEAKVVGTRDYDLIVEQISG
jgi:ribosomal protein S12 methylthiotransferase